MAIKEELLPRQKDSATANDKLELRLVLDACEKLSRKINDTESEVYRLLDKSLEESFGQAKVGRQSQLLELAELLSKQKLDEKIVRELGVADPFEFSRPDHRRNVFEKWSPLGTLLHIVSPFTKGGIPPNAAIISIVDGLLLGNRNILLHTEDDTFTRTFFQLLSQFDASGTIARHIDIRPIETLHREGLTREAHTGPLTIFSEIDCVIVLGDEDFVAKIRQAIPDKIRFVSRIAQKAIAYFANGCIDNVTTIQAFAKQYTDAKVDVSLLPRLVFLESTNVQDYLLQLSNALGSGWKVEVDKTNNFYESLRKPASDFTILLKPIKRANIGQILAPFKSTIHTTALACNLDSTYELSESLIKAGVQKIVEIDAITQSYSGQPSNGEYYLPKFLRRVSAQLGSVLDGISNLSALLPSQTQAPSGPIMGKEDFQDIAVDVKYADLYFKSGGSSGEPKLSIFGYRDYQIQHRAQAEGLFAAGLDPKSDRCMNLYRAGGLYGAFVSFCTVLEYLQAVQFPMASHADLKMVAETIVANNCNVLIGVPTYILQLFNQNAELFLKHKTVTKIYYGGEHINQAQRNHLKQFGVKLIRSSGYGSVDTGPIAYQCNFCEGGEHHLHSHLHVLEFLDLGKDEPSAIGEPGRIIVSSLQRAGQSINRYDAGDIGRIVPGDCPCGRKSLKFEVLGRHGDVFRFGGRQLNYKRFAQIFTDELNYTGELQLVLEPNGTNKEKLVLRSTHRENFPATAIHDLVLAKYSDLREIIQLRAGLLELEIANTSPGEFARTQSSGKLIRVIDQRTA
jgi:phenylacetate-coenzyme A ligase PaaK-like adenylate-forming protein